jgi:hypothetical protein
MGICKNVGCANETKKNNVYCSLSCRNYYVNKFIRDYSKNGDAITEKHKKGYIIKRCKNPSCDLEIPYKQRRNIFCCNSCAASVTNLGKIKSSETIVKVKKTWENKEECNRTIECKNCKCLIKTKLRKTFCCLQCKKDYQRKNMDEFNKFKQDTLFKFSLNQYPDAFDFSLIKKYGWYSPSNKKNNIGGVSRDHMLSVRGGFELGLDPFLLAHPANCRLMIHGENISKNKKSIITKDELEELITLWGIKDKLSTMKRLDA